MIDMQYSNFVSSNIYRPEASEQHEMYCVEVKTLLFGGSVVELSICSILISKLFICMELFFVIIDRFSIVFKDEIRG
mgnify:FL=1